MKKLNYALLIAAAILTFSSCKKNNNDPSNGGTSGTNGAGAATVTAANYGFDGQSGGKFSSTKAGIIQQTVAGVTTFAISAIKDGSNEAITITVLHKISATGKFTFGPAESNGGIIITKDYTKPADPGLNYSTNNSGSSSTGGGEINVTSLNGNNIEGTFYVVAYNGKGSAAFAEQGTFKGTIKQ
jgi:hypothetical protein